MAGAACPGHCNRAYREAQDAYSQALALYDPLDKAQERPQPPDIAPWYGEPVWCVTCTAKISRRLGELDDLACILQRFADGHRDAPDSPMVASSTEPMSPSQAGDTADDLARMLGGWEHAYRDLRGWPYPRREGDLASWITTCSAWLSAHLAGILASPLAEDFGKEVLSWHSTLTTQAKAGTRKLTKPMRCPGCQQLTLTWTEGEEVVCCSDPSCRVVMAYGEYQNEVERRTGTAALENPGVARLTCAALGV